MPRHDRIRSFLLVDVVPAVAVLAGGMALGAGVASAAQSLTTDTAVVRLSCDDAARAVDAAVSGAESAVLAGGLAGAGRGGCAGGGSGVAAAALAGGAGAGGPAVDLDGVVGAAGRDLDRKPAKNEPDPEPEPESEPEPEPEPATESVWDRLARCESAGNWSIDTGNGYFGGLQFDMPTWRDYDGTEFAPRADRATKAEQIEVATRVRDDRGGYGSWPACSAMLGLPR